MSLHNSEICHYGRLSSLWSLAPAVSHCQSWTATAVWALCIIHQSSFISMQLCLLAGKVHHQTELAYHAHEIGQQRSLVGLIWSSYCPSVQFHLHAAAAACRQIVSPICTHISHTESGKAKEPGEPNLELASHSAVVSIWSPAENHRLVISKSMFLGAPVAVAACRCSSPFENVLENSVLC